MSDKFIRHLIAFIGTFVCLMAFWAGYQSGQEGWWWAGFAVVGIYMVLYKLIDV